MLRNKSPLFQNIRFSFVDQVLIGPLSYFLYRRARPVNTWRSHAVHFEIDVCVSHARPVPSRAIVCTYVHGTLFREWTPTENSSRYARVGSAGNARPVSTVKRRLVFSQNRKNRPNFGWHSSSGVHGTRCRRGRRHRAIVTQSPRRSFTRSPHSSSDFDSLRA